MSPKPARDDERISYRRYLTEQVYLDYARQHIVVHPFLVAESIASTAIEHPEWPMDQERTRAQWEEYEG